MSVAGHCEAFRSADADTRVMWNLRQRLSLRRVQSSTSVEFILSSCLLRVFVYCKINLLLGTFSYFVKLFSCVGTNSRKFSARRYDGGSSRNCLPCVSHRSLHRLQVSHVDLHNRCNGQCANDSARAWCVQPAKQADGNSLNTALVYGEGIVQYKPMLKFSSCLIIMYDAHCVLLVFVQFTESRKGNSVENIYLVQRRHTSDD
jgi:hypothetical protein